MLPLELFTDEVRVGFRAHQVDEKDIDLAVELDLDENGDFGESWLAVSRTKQKLYRISITSDAETENKRKLARESADNSSKIKNLVPPDLFEHSTFAEYDLTSLANAYIDNFVSSNRLLAKNTEGTTITIAYCTNARKRKLFAFLDLMVRIQKEEEIQEDDPIFEQFHLRCPKCHEVYKDQNRKICDTCMKKGAIMKRLLSYFKGFEVQLFTVLGCMVATSLVALINPIINGMLLYDNVINVNGSMHTDFWLYVVIGVVFGMALLSLGIGIIQNRANARMSTRVTLNMKMDIFTAMQHLSLSFFNNNQTGRLITRVNYDADRIRNFFIDGIPNLIINSLNFIGLTIFLFLLNWKLTLIVFVPVPIIVFMFKFMLPKLWRMYNKQWRRSSSLNAMLGDSLNGVRVVKAFAKESEETNRFYGYSTRLYEANLQVNLVSLTIFPIIGLLIAVSSNAIWGFGGFTVMGGEMTYGEFSTYFGYLGMIFGPLNFFTNFTNMITDTANAAQRMFEIIDAIPEITDAPDAVTLDPVKGNIEFKKVCFHYTANRPILKDVSFQIHSGDHIGLVGHTGSGKSTIANLINRLYDVISGSILLDGVNVKNVKTDVLRKNIAIVSQEIFLFKGTIADNIRYARPEASMQEVIDAAKAANAHDFILSLPDGYETLVGTGSRSLSGGEQQRISIARALLLAPKILILDEATAAMDTETERLIQDALNLLIQGRTTITIAHRLSTLKDCNYLFAIENGEIAEEGTHAALIAKKGLYYKLYTLQSEAMKRVIAGD